MARLPRLLGRGRALEVLLTAHELNGDLAELYGYVNRSLPDALLDDFVDRSLNTKYGAANSSSQKPVLRPVLPS
jgi:enoyl-CoA hydratase/carnithine racemase